MTYTEKQKKQLNFVDMWEYDYIHAQRSHIVSCKTCDENRQFAAASSVRIFINFHIGHNTTYFATK